MRNINIYMTTGGSFWYGTGKFHPEIGLCGVTQALNTKTRPVVHQYKGQIKGEG